MLHRVTPGYGQNIIYDTFRRLDAVNGVSSIDMWIMKNVNVMSDVEQTENVDSVIY